MANNTMPAMEYIRMDALTNPNINTEGDVVLYMCQSKAVAFDTIFRTRAIIEPVCREYLRTHKTDKLRTAEPLDAFVERMIYTHTVARNYKDYDVCDMPCLEKEPVKLLIRKRRTA